MNQMKKMILSVFALTVMATVSYAQNASQQTAPAPAAQTDQQTAQEKKTPVDANNLPAAVKKAMAADEYKEWKLVSGWQIEGATPYYVLELQKGEERRTVKLDSTGKAL